jgi:hypothetical protein
MLKIIPVPAEIRQARRKASVFHAVRYIVCRLSLSKKCALTRKVLGQAQAVFQAFSPAKLRN